jgi:hypothetical protein
MSKTTTTPATSEAPKFVRKEALLLPSYSIKDIAEGASIYVKIDKAMETKLMFDKAGKPEMDNGEQKTISFVQVTDLTTGERGEMVLPFMIHKALDNMDAQHGVAGSYVGKCFELIKGAKKGRTNEWTTYEIEA